MAKLALATHFRRMSSRDRIASEKAFHNETYAEGKRLSTYGYYEIFIGIRDDFRERVRQLVKGKDVLELGCGIHTFAPEFAPSAKSLIGIDISEEAVAQSKAIADKAGVSNAEFRVMNAEELELPDHSISLIMGSGIIHHLDLEVFFRECARVLDTEGRILFMEPMGHNPIINLYRSLTPSIRTPDEHPLLRSDLDLARRHFREVHVKYYYFLTLLAVPFRRMPFFRGLVRFLDGADQLFFRLIPGARYMAWYILLEASGPRNA